MGGYAVRKDGMGWRTVEDESWCSEDEIYQPGMPSQSMAMAKVLKVSQLGSDYDAACQASVSYTSEAGVQQVYQADTKSQQLLQASIAGLAGAQQTPPGFAWLAEDNTPVSFSFADLQGLAQAMYLQGYQAFVKLQQLKNQVSAATSVEEVEALVW